MENYLVSMRCKAHLLKGLKWMHEGLLPYLCFMVIVL